MYTEFFKLKELPFRLAADPRFHFLAPSRESARTRLRNGLRDADGCLLLTGEPGMGKTSLVLDLLQELPEPNTLVQVRNPDMSVGEFYQAILGQMDERPAPSARAALLAAFDTCLAREAAMCRTTVVFVDNAELAPPELLEEILRMSRRSSGSRYLRVLLVGEPAVVMAMRAHNGRARTSDVGLTEIIGPLEPKEMAQYLDCRVAVAAGSAKILFDDGAVAELVRFAGGVPRRINMLADAALARAFDAGHHQVGAANVRSAADKLQWVEYTASRPPGGATYTAPVPRPEPTSVSESAGHLRIEHHGALLAEFDLPVGRISLGRALNNDVRIDSPYISRHHCQVLTTPQYSVIEDLQSQNGIVVGKRRVSVHRLQHEDRLDVGDYVLVFSRTGRPPVGRADLFPLLLRAPHDVTDVVQTRLMIKQASVDSH